jgi:hypothetical protein
MPAPLPADDIVDPYAAALATAYHLAPAHSEAEATLERIFVNHCFHHDIDGDALLEKVGAYLSAEAAS